MEVPSDATLDSFNSALTPAGPVALAIADIYWIMIYVLGITFVVVMLLTAFSVWFRQRPHQSEAPLGNRWFIILGGIVVPAIVITYLLIYTLATQAEFQEPPADALTVEVTGHMWWWEVRYPDSGVVTANEIYIPVGKPVRLELTAEHVIHSLWVPSLAGKTDLIPGMKTQQWFTAEKAGVYRGQCAEFCGIQHARMSIFVVALPPEKFAEWVRERTEAQPLPNDPLLALGHETYMEVGCAECHRIRGTEATSEVGPDLTHIGSRLSLGAGTIANNHGNLAGWVADPQALKPGNKMPAAYIDPEKYEALIAYLMSLK